MAGQVGEGSGPLLELDPSGDQSLAFQFKGLGVGF